MSSLVDRLAHVATRPLTRDLFVVGVTDIADEFRRVGLTSASPLQWEPGQKVQVHVQGFEFRTYTPFGWDGERVALLAALDATGPGTALMAGLEVGDRVSVFGPRGAMKLSGLDAAPILIGDETSFALAAAWELGDGRAPVAQLYEVGDRAASTLVCHHLGLGGVELVERSADDVHLAQLCAAAVSAVRAHPNAPMVLTGSAPTIRAVRGALKDAGLSPTARVKAHWDPKRSGLD